MIKRIGDRLILIGVAHVLPESKEEVKKHIREEKPKVVGIELCQKRYIELTTGPQQSRSGGFDFSRVGILARILRFIQEVIGEKTGMLPGEEMLTAVREAEDVGAEIRLIDRDVDETLSRLINEMPVLEKIKIALEVLTSPFRTGQEIKLEDVTKEEVVDELLSALKNMSKTTYKVLIEERNEYMAERISEILKTKPGKVICVVGAGHVPGLSETLESRFDESTLDPWSEYHMEWSVE